MDGWTSAVVVLECLHIILEADDLLKTSLALINGGTSHTLWGVLIRHTNRGSVNCTIQQCKLWILGVMAAVRALNMMSDH